MLPDNPTATRGGDPEDGGLVAAKDPQPPPIPLGAEYRPPGLVGMDLPFLLTGADAGLIPGLDQGLHAVQRARDRAGTHSQAGQAEPEPLAMDRETEEKLRDHELGQKSRGKAALRNGRAGPGAVSRAGTGSQ